MKKLLFLSLMLLNSILYSDQFEYIMTGSGTNLQLEVKRDGKVVKHCWLSDTARKTLNRLLVILYEMGYTDEEIEIAQNNARNANRGYAPQVHYRSKCDLYISTQKGEVYFVPAGNFSIRQYLENNYWVSNQNDYFLPPFEFCDNECYISSRNGSIRLGFDNQYVKVKKASNLTVFDKLYCWLKS